MAAAVSSQVVSMPRRFMGSGRVPLSGTGRHPTRPAPVGATTEGRRHRALVHRRNRDLDQVALRPADLYDHGAAAELVAQALADGGAVAHGRVRDGGLRGLAVLAHVDPGL